MRMLLVFAALAMTSANANSLEAGDEASAWVLATSAERISWVDQVITVENPQGTRGIGARQLMSCLDSLLQGRLSSDAKSMTLAEATARCMVAARR